jgi:hypothetical protein
MAAVETQEIRAQSYVGFETITRQIEHKLLKRGFQFNVMVVGALFFISLHSYVLTELFYRPNWIGKVDYDQHHLCVPPRRLQRPA